MQEQTAPEPKPIANVPHKKGTLKAILLILLVVVLMSGSAGGSYWWRNKKAVAYERTQAATIVSLQKDKTDLQKQVTTLKAASTAKATSTTSAACTPKAPNATTIDNIEASITSGNTAALQGYMATTVQDVYAAADAIPPKTAAESVTDITGFVSDQITGTWSFSVSAADLATYRAGSYAQYFPSIAVVGSSTRHRVISFSFDCNGKISTVFMAANDSVL